MSLGLVNLIHIAGGLQVVFVTLGVSDLLGCVKGLVVLWRLLVYRGLAELLAEVKEDIGSGDLDERIILSLEEDNVVLVNVLEKQVSEHDVYLLPLSGNEL